MTFNSAFAAAIAAGGILCGQAAAAATACELGTSYTTSQGGGTTITSNLSAGDFVSVSGDDLVADPTLVDCEVISAVEISNNGRSNGSDSQAGVRSTNPFALAGDDRMWNFLTKWQVDTGGGDQGLDADSVYAAGGEGNSATAPTGDFDEALGDGDSYGDFIVQSDYITQNGSPNAFGTSSLTVPSTVDTFASDGASGYFVITEEARILYDEIVLLMKAQDFFYIYRISDIAGLPEYVYYESPYSGTISHISFYGVQSALSTVPVPPAAPLLLGALGLLGWRARRRG